MSKAIFAWLWLAGEVALGQTPVVLHRFTSASGGCGPESTLTEVRPGVFFGTTSGGAGSAVNGIIFRITAAGQYTALHAFSKQAEGANPQGTLLNAHDGNLYGITTGQSGADATIFRSDRLGNVTLLYTFTGGMQNFLLPSPLIEATDGNLYGTTSQIDDGTGNVGSFFQMTLAGSVTVLHTFISSEGTPNGPVIQATDGNFYGLNLGGAYRITSAGVFTQIAAIGLQPFGSLHQAANQRLYGVNQVNNVYEMSLEGMYANLHNFTDGSDGGYPSTALMQATDGNLYGTTAQYGTNGLGTIFRLGPSGGLTTIYEFTSVEGGLSFSPDSAMIQSSNGVLYGLTYGTCGSIYYLNFGLTDPKPGIKFFYPTSGAVGAAIQLVGANFLGATSVAFNGVPAGFEVTGANYIGALVPAGATSGKISVTTGHGTAVSVTSFTVN